MIILDTNVLSELMKPADAASEAVLDWFGFLTVAEAFTTSITLAETLSGIELMPGGRRKNEKKAAAERVVALFAGRVFPFDEQAATYYAPLLSERRRAGRSIAPFDMQIAAIALACDMGVATRNVRDFEDCGVAVVDPWVL
ncbi:type II toxin-antitoxin system VapC family toxin [Kaistia dalseonensis]|uniref:Ribonuclease VapC n=1 Tax=Kaistia dalseonensis TaxID=410840 RepID=A0ABU0H5H9_9HYPH|nr:type II toxin-antitoxin system VapC family toxin [Kaistia dalseonensis]MCX5494969.1 type II toxin-antitoxin system VapC family toxin [Kaistia dalseonensis]MDQ0437550.1 putative nucleic acid-binding protein [Kaistia dalseonensis]